MASRKKIHSDAFVVRKSSVHGRGAFAVRPIRKGSRLVEYTGRKLTQDQADELYPDDDDEPHHTFLFELDDEWVIDASVRGNKARWINHSCDPNCEAVIEDGRIWIEAIRSIRSGQELNYDYGFILDEPHTPAAKRRYPCRCGAVRCRGTILAKKR